MHFVFVFSIIIASALAIESNFYAEESCTKAKGFCLLESECPHAVKASHKELCAGQKKDGAVCCTNFPQEDVNCYQFHDTCRDGCPRQLNRGRKGCPAGQTCCTLV